MADQRMQPPPEQARVGKIAEMFEAVPLSIGRTPSCGRNSAARAASGLMSAVAMARRLRASPRDTARTTPTMSQALMTSRKTITSAPSVALPRRSAIVEEAPTA